MDGKRGLFDADDERTAAISAEVEALIRDFLGRSPSAVRTSIVADVVVCTFHDTMTAAERVLADGDHELAGRRARRALQDGLGGPASEVIERNLGRRVRAVLNDHDQVLDVAALIFILAEPVPGG